MKADFSKIIRDSIQITKSNKNLWVFGLVIVALGAGSNFGSGGNYSSSSRDTNNHKQENSIDYRRPNTQDKSNYLNSNLVAANIPQVLGTATSTFGEVIKTIPVSLYLALGLLLILCICLGVSIAVYGRSWAVSGLIQGINKQSSGETLSLYQMSDHGKRNAIEVIKISIIPGLLFALSAFLAVIVLIIPCLLLGDAGKVLLVLFSILLVTAIVIISIVLSASINLGMLAINLESLKWKDGFRRGFKVFRTYLMDMIIMSIINCFTGCVFGIAALAGILVLGGIGVASVFGVVAFPPFLVLAGPIIFLAVLALIMFMGLVGSISVVFKQSTWVLLYKQLTEETTSGQ